MIQKINKRLINIALLFSMILSVNATVLVSKQPHENSVTMFAPQTNSNNIYSVGLDGFVISWDEEGNGTHFQVSDMEIRKISVNPLKSEIAVYETDGFSIHRVSVWNWQTQTRRYAKRFTDSVTSLSYSAKGTKLLVGTAAVDGLIVFDSVTGKQLPKWTDTTGTVSMAITSSSELTCCAYAPSGKLSYYNIADGTRKARFSVQTSLESPVLYNDNLLFAGVKDNVVYIYLADTGELLTKINSSSAIVFPSKEDESILYLVSFDGRKTYTLSEITSNYDLNQFSVNELEKFTLNGIKAEITTIYEENSKVVLGTSAGEIYSLPIKNTAFEDDLSNTIEGDAKEQDGNVQIKKELLVSDITPFTEKLYDKILDIGCIDSFFYFLTDDSLFKSSYYTTEVLTVCQNPGKYKNILTGQNSLYLWAKGEKQPVCTVSDTGVITRLFTPDNELESLRLFDNKLIGIEGSTTVIVYDLKTKKRSSVYSGTGLQDAVLYSENDLYVSKSSSSNPKSPLIHVDINTKETVMMPLSGDISFSLDFEKEEVSPPIYGVSVSADGLQKNTMIFSFDTLTKTVSTILQWADEDTDAFVSIYNGRIYTNIGKTQVRSHQIENKKEVKLTRSAALPVKVTRNDVSVLVLNKDGSISWYNPDSQYILSDWYITVDKEWTEL